jgi:hypothetical protein
MLGLAAEHAWLEAQKMVKKNPKVNYTFGCKGE